MAGTFLKKDTSQGLSFFLLLDIAKLEPGGLRAMK